MVLILSTSQILILWISVISVITIFYIDAYYKVLFYLEKHYQKVIKKNYGLTELPLLTLNFELIKKRSKFYKDLLFTDKLNLNKEMITNIFVYRCLYVLYSLVFALLLFTDIFFHS